MKSFKDEFLVFILNNQKIKLHIQNGQVKIKSHLNIKFKYKSY